MRGFVKILLSWLVMILCVYPHTVLAHKVIVFAWVENGMIHIEGSFGGKNKVHSGIVEVVNEQGQAVFKGQTDEKGYLSFGIPDHNDSDLIVILEAGTAHKARWKIPIEELVLPASKETVAQKMETKKHLEEDPSLIKVLSGIGIIFLLAFFIHRVRKRKMIGS